MPGADSHQIASFANKRTDSKNNIRFKAEADESKKESTAYDYAGKTSSTLDAYKPLDLLKDLSLPSNDVKDVVEDIKNKDYVSAYLDIARNKPGFGNLPETAKDTSRLIWKAGSELYLKPKGLTISADMLEHSLQENPKDVVFYEDSDIAKKIKNDNNFLMHLDKVVNKVENKTPLTDDDKSYNFAEGDLFYSIHGCQMTIDDIKYNADGTKSIDVHLHDTYDFTKIWTAMSDNKLDMSKLFDFGSLVNDGGTISSKLDGINPYEVDIYFTIRR